MAERSRGSRAPRRLDAVTLSATEAQNAFGRMLETVVKGRPVIITKRDRPQAVLISMERYRELAGSDEAALDTLAAEFDALLERMQAPETRAAVRRAYGSSVDRLARAAVAEASRRGRGTGS